MALQDLDMSTTLLIRPKRCLRAVHDVGLPSHRSPDPVHVWLKYHGFDIIVRPRSCAALGQLFYAPAKCLRLGFTHNSSQGATLELEGLVHRASTACGSCLEVTACTTNRPRP